MNMNNRKNKSYEDRAYNLTATENIFLSQLPVNSIYTIHKYTQYENLIAVLHNSIT